MSLMKLMSSEKLILTFIVVSFSFGVPVLVRFLNKWSIFVLLSMCSVQHKEIQHFTYNSSALWAYFFIAMLDRDLLFLEKNNLILKKQLG